MSDYARAGLIQTTEIADQAVTEAKLADDAVTTAKIADQAVNTPQLASLCIGVGKIADGAVSAIKLSSNAVRSSNMSSAQSSASGTLVAGQHAYFVLGAYAFWPMISSSGGMVLEPHNTDGGSANEGRFGIFNDTGINRDYAVDWRQMNA